MENLKTASVVSYEKEDLRRNLKSRHLEMISIGGAIGTGLFYGSSWSIKQAGPAITIVYLLAAVAIYFIVRALGEMAVEEPVSGSFVSYANRYIGRFAGFVCGWNSLILILSTTAAEFNALGTYIQFWFPSIPIWLTALCATAMLSLINLVSVKYFGEIEFWFSFVKVAAIICLIVFGFGMILFGFGIGGHPIGFSNLTSHGGFMPNGASGLFFAFVIVAFAYGGIEDLGMAAGEVRNVKKSMRTAINCAFWRLLLFYVGAIFVLVTVFPWTDLADSKGSPFVSLFSMVGIPAAASIMNLVVITAVLSAVNSYIFFHSRKLYNMALHHNAPAFLGKVNGHNVPSRAIFLVLFLMFCSTALNYFIPDGVFQLFSSISVCCLLYNWACITFSHLKFRKFRMRLGIADNLSYKSPFYPFSDYLVLAFILVVLCGIALMPQTRLSLLVAAIWTALSYGAYKIMTRRQSVVLTSAQPVADKR